MICCLFNRNTLHVSFYAAVHSNILSNDGQIRNDWWKITTASRRLPYRWRIQLKVQNGYYYENLQTSSWSSCQQTVSLELETYVREIICLTHEQHEAEHELTSKPMQESVFSNLRQFILEQL